MGINTDSKLSTSGVLNNLCIYLDYAAVSINPLTAECPLFAPFLLKQTSPALFLPNASTGMSRMNNSCHAISPHHLLQKILPHFTFYSIALLNTNTMLMI